MTALGKSLDPALLEALGELGINEAAPPDAATWQSCLGAISSLLKQREEAAETHRRAVGAPLRSAPERAFDAFLSTMSHELRTPMAVVIGCLDLLGKSVDGEARDMLTTARRASLELVRTIDDILDYCCIEAGQLAVVKRPFALERLVEDVVSRHRQRCRDRGVRIEYEWEPKLPRHIVADPHRMEQVLDALLDNALKFTEQGVVRVVLRAEDAVLAEECGTREPTIRVSVADSGPGIAQELLDQIFAPFRQLDGAPSRRYGGIGLGLALAKRLVSAMGGRLQVTSEPGRGSEFSFWLRLEPASEPVAMARKPRPSPHDVPRVLLAEDNQFNRSFIERSLTPLGCKVRAVPHGRALLAAIKGFRPDLVLMDVQMPEMDGLSAARHVRAMSGPLASVPIIALTANGGHADRTRCEEAGMDEVLVKPVAVGILQAVVGRWLQVSSDVEVESEPAPITEPAGESPTSCPASALVGELLPGAAGVLDLGRVEELVQQAGSTAILRELSEIFLVDVEVRLAGLSEALKSGNLDQVRRIAHAVRGSSANFGALEMAEYAQRLETGSIPIEHEQDLALLVQSFGKVRQVLEHVVVRADAADGVALANYTGSQPR